MNRGVPPPNEHMVAEAARWLALLGDDTAAPGQRAAFQAWCEQDPRHALAAQRMQALWGGLDEVPAAPARAALNRAFKGRRGGLARGAVGLLLLAGLALGLWRSGEPALWLADQRSAVGETRRLTLADGSELQLDTDTALNIRFNGHQRVIELLRGEAWFVVAKDPLRPFVVRTDQGSVTALGTRFLVSREADGATRVSVLESAVAAQPSGGAAVRVAAGQWARFNHGRLQAPQAIGKADPSAWTRGVLSAQNAPLAEVLASLGRYRHGVLSFDPEALAGLRVSGVFPLNDSDAALQALSDSLPIEVARLTDWYVTVKPR